MTTPKCNGAKTTKIVKHNNIPQTTKCEGFSCWSSKMSQTHKRWEQTQFSHSQFHVRST
jgi:hypothetical protein